MDAGSTLCALLRRSPRLDSAMEACSGAHSYGRKAHRSNLHRLSHPRSRCSHNAAPSGWAGRLPAAELPWSALSMKLGRPLVRGAQVAAARQRAGAQEDRMEVASPSPRPWRLLGCEGPPHAGLGFSAWARPCAVGRLGQISGVRGGWCVDRGGRVRFIKVATPRIAPRSGPRTVEAARRPQFVSTARRAPGEDWSLRSTVCRHQESRESSDEHEVAPCRVRARGLPHASRPLRARRWVAPICLTYAAYHPRPPPLEPS